MSSLIASPCQMIANLVKSDNGTFFVEGTLRDAREKAINERFEVFLCVTIHRNGTVFNFFS